MKILRVWAVLAVATGLGLSAAQATVFLNDDFGSYSDGNLVGQGGWVQTGTIGTNPIQVNGGKAVLGTSGQDAYNPFTLIAPATAGTSLYTSFDLTVTSVQATGDYFLHLSNPAGTTLNFYERVFAKSSGSGFVLGLVDTSGTGSTTTYGTTELALGVTYDVTIAWNFVAGANNDTFAIYLGTDPTPYLTHTWTSATAEPTQLAAANFRQGSASSAAGVTIDNLEISDVNPIPEPATLSLAAVAGLLALRRNRKVS